MSYYASGEICGSKPFPQDLIENGAGCITELGVYEIESLSDDVEEEIHILMNYANENGFILEGSVEIDTGDEKGIYVFQNSTQYEEYWGDDYYIRYMNDESLIDELKRRGYKVEKEKR